MNTQVINEIRDALKLTTNERLPNPIPVIEVNPKLVKTDNYIYKVYTSSGSTTIYTCPTNQDTYLKEVVFSLIKNAACDGATGSVSFLVVVNGATLPFYIPTITLTAQETSIKYRFPNGLKLDRGSIMSLSNNTFTAGIMVRSVGITYSTDEYGNA